MKVKFLRKYGKYKIGEVTEKVIEEIPEVLIPEEEKEVKNGRGKGGKKE